MGRIRILLPPPRGKRGDTNWVAAAVPKWQVKPRSSIDHILGRVTLLCGDARPGPMDARRPAHSDLDWDDSWSSPRRHPCDGRHPLRNELTPSLTGTERRRKPIPVALTWTANDILYTQLASRSRGHRVSLRISGRNVAKILNLPRAALRIWHPCLGGKSGRNLPGSPNAAAQNEI